MVYLPAFDIQKSTTCIGIYMDGMDCKDPYEPIIDSWDVSHGFPFELSRGFAAFVFATVVSLIIGHLCRQVIFYQWPVFIGSLNRW